MAMVLNPPRLSSPSSTRVSRETAGKAVDALLKWIRAQAKHKKAQLLDHDDLIHLVLTLRRIPAKGRTNPYLIPIPHPLHPLSLSDTAICLFVDDRPNSPVSPAAVEARIKAEGIPVSEVIGIGALRTDYMPYEARRKLCGSYDLFFADRRVLPLLPRLLGKQFFKKKKHPLPVDLSHKGWKEQIGRSCGSALLYLRTGTSCQLNVGRVSMGREEIVDNVVSAVEESVRFVPRGWANVRSFHVKSEGSVGLPIYQALPEMGLKIEVVAKEVPMELEDAGGDNTDSEVIHGTREGKKERVVKKVGSKKGRLHEVRYMDTNLDEENEGFTSGDGGDEKGGVVDQGEDVLPVEEQVGDNKKKRKVSKKKVIRNEEELATEKEHNDDDGAQESIANAKDRKNKKKQKQGKKEFVVHEPEEKCTNYDNEELSTKSGRENKSDKKVIRNKEELATDKDCIDDGDDAWKSIADAKDKKNKKKQKQGKKEIVVHESEEECTKNGHEEGDTKSGRENKSDKKVIRNKEKLNTNKDCIDNDDGARNSIANTKDKKNKKKQKHGKVEFAVSKPEEECTDNGDEGDTKSNQENKGDQKKRKKKVEEDVVEEAAEEQLEKNSKRVKDGVKMKSVTKKQAEKEGEQKKTKKSKVKH